MGSPMIAVAMLGAGRPASRRTAAPTVRRTAWLSLALGWLASLVNDR